MPFKADVLTVMIASPNDMAEQRGIAEDAILSWNRRNGERRGVLLLPLRWELDAIPTMFRGDAQQTITRQLVAKADIVLALFHTRLGTPTGRALAGTAEELEEARRRGLTVHVWESEANIPRDHDPEQLAKLRAYLAQLSEDGLIGSFRDQHHLREQLLGALDDDVNVHLVAHPRQPQSLGDDGSDGADGASISRASNGVTGDEETTEVDEEEFLWPVDDLRRLAADDHPGAMHATRLMDLLATNVNEYFPTSELIVALNITWDEHKRLMGAFVNVMRRDFQELDGYWPLSYDWRRSADTYGKNARQNHYYLSEGQGARWLEARGGAQSAE